MTATEELDPVTKDMLIGQLRRSSSCSTGSSAPTWSPPVARSAPAGEQGEQPAAQAAAGDAPRTPDR